MGLEGGCRTEVGVVVPCYNAGLRLRPVVQGLLEVVDHVIVVDDGSTDGAPAALADLAVRLISFPENRGKGCAMLAGFRVALEDPQLACVGIVDADGQHDPSELPRLYEAFLREGADLVIGSRMFGLEQVPWRSRLGNRLTIGLTRLLFGQRLPDTQSGYRLHSRRFLEAVVEEVPGGRYETEMQILVKALQEGYKVTPVPIRTIYEEGNPSSHFDNLRDSYRIWRTLFSAAFRPHRR